ncbi:MAG: YitT family protein [Clostridia bacterium]|nr:YitT family protein [Clostridia bacterium]
MLSEKQKKISYWMQSFVLILASSFLVSFAAHCLIEPNEFTIGGVAGAAIMISYATNQVVPQSLIVFCVNMPLLIVSYFFVKKRFALLTIANILLQTLWLFILEQTNAPIIEFTDNGTRIFAAVAAGICIGTSVALALKAGGSTGGIDVIAVLVQKKFSAGSIAQMIFLLNSIVIGISFFVFKKEDQSLAVSLLPILLSLFEAYIESKANDSITNGFQSAVEFRVVTSKPDEMAAALMTQLSRGVTVAPAKGMYTKEEKGLLICVISRRQINAFKRIIKEIDSDSFAVLTNVSQVVGLGFYQSEN